MRKQTWIFYLTIFFNWYIFTFIILELNNIKTVQNIILIKFFSSRREICTWQHWLRGITADSTNIHIVKSKNKHVRLKISSILRMHINKILGNEQIRRGRKSKRSPARFRSRSIAFSSWHRKKRALVPAVHDQFRRVTSGRATSETKRSGREDGKNARHEWICIKVGAQSFLVVPTAGYFSALLRFSPRAITPLVRDFRARTCLATTMSSHQLLPPRKKPKAYLRSSPES